MMDSFHKRLIDRSWKRLLKKKFRDKKEDIKAL